jgi:hypothetical protein
VKGMLGQGSEGAEPNSGPITGLSEIELQDASLSGLPTLRSSA